MSLHTIKTAMSALWIVAALITLLVAGASMTVNIAIVALGVLPPVALLLLWNDPAPTMSEPNNDERR
jgi:hypothetical protein